MPAKIFDSARSYQGLCGGASFSIASFFKGLTWSWVPEAFECFVDGQKIKPKSEEGDEDAPLDTGMIVVSNSKYFGGGAIINPHAALNDGLVDITWVHDPAVTGYFGLGSVISKASKSQGTQVYEEHSSYMRGKKITIKSRSEDPSERHAISVDGQCLEYTSQVTWEVQPRNLEVLFDADSYFTELQGFVLDHN